MPIKPNKKMLPLDRIFKETVGSQPATTKRINDLYHELGHAKKVDDLLKNPTLENAMKAKTVLNQFHDELYPRELDIYFENHPNLDPIKDFKKGSDDVEKRIGPVFEKRPEDRDRIAEEWKAKFLPGQQNAELQTVNRMDEMSTNDLFYLHELTHQPKYGVEIDKRIADMKNGWKQRYPKLFEDEK